MPKISLELVAERRKNINSQEVLKAFEIQKIYNRLLKRRGSKDLEGFIKTATYPHYLRLARFSNSVQIPNIELYLQLMVVANKKPSNWTSDSSYRIFLEKMNSDLIAQEAIKISADCLQTLAEKNSVSVPEVVASFQISEIYHLVRQRRISPWLILHSSKFRKKFNDLTGEEQKIAEQIINPNYWRSMIQNNKTATNLAKQVVELLEI